MWWIVIAHTLAPAIGGVVSEWSALRGDSSNLCHRSDARHEGRTGHADQRSRAMGIGSVDHQKDKQHKDGADEDARGEIGGMS
jgi:hypothetical protein